MSLGFRMKPRSTTGCGEREIGAWMGGYIPKCCHSLLGIWLSMRVRLRHRELYGIRCSFGGRMDARSLDGEEINWRRCVPSRQKHGQDRIEAAVLTSTHR